MPMSNSTAEPMSLYLLTVASSGDRKSAVDHLALKASRDWERQQWTLYAEKLKTYRAASSFMTKPKTAKKTRGDGRL